MSETALYREVGTGWSCGRFKTIYMHEGDPAKAVFESPPVSNNFYDLNGDPPGEEFMEWIAAQ